MANHHAIAGQILFPAIAIFRYQASNDSSDTPCRLQYGRVDRPLTRRSRINYRNRSSFAGVRQSLLARGTVAIVRLLSPDGSVILEILRPAHLSRLSSRVHHRQQLCHWYKMCLDGVRHYAFGAWQYRQNAGRDIDIPQFHGE